MDDILGDLLGDGKSLSFSSEIFSRPSISCQTKDEGCQHFVRVLGAFADDVLPKKGPTSVSTDIHVSCVCARCAFETGCSCFCLYL